MYFLLCLVCKIRLKIQSLIIKHLVLLSIVLETLYYLYLSQQTCKVVGLKRFWSQPHPLPYIPLKVVDDL